MNAGATLDPLLPRPPGGLREGALLAIAAHGALIAALVWGLNWRATAPDTISAELWAAVPQQAAPRAEPAPAPPPAPAPAPAPAPPPAPAKAEPAQPDPQIAIEREKREKREREQREREQRAEQERREREARVEKERQQQREARERQAREAEAREKKEREAAEARLARQREENLKRMMGQIGASGPANATGSATHDAAPSRGYAGRLVAHIKPNIVFTETVSGNPAAEVEVRAAPSGTIVSRRLVKSSGNKDWDDAVLRAIDRTATLPKDVDGRVPPTLLIAFRPND